jgi:hypothetical protein
LIIRGRILPTLSAQTTLPLHPKKPRLAFRVGVIGHRPDRLGGADLACLSRRIREILETIRAAVEEFGRADTGLFSDEPLTLRAVTSLAEGVDRLFAAAALDVGFALCCPFPFDQAEFERDFVAPASTQPGSIEEFRALQTRAADQTELTRFEMDGDPSQRPAAYAACGRVVVDQSDVLCVVWDGERKRREGGTEHTLEYACARSVPVIWIDARAPHDWQFLNTSAIAVSPGERAVPHTDIPLANVGQLSLDALRLPADERRLSDEMRSPGIHGFYNERISGPTVGLPWRLFRRVLGSRDDRSSAGTREAPESVRVTDGPGADVVDRLNTFLLWPDRLAVAYSDLYRSSFVVTYLLAAAAVGMALLPLALGWDVLAPHAAEVPFILTELALIASIVLIVWRGRARGWHERWLDYRLAAEFIRQLRFVAPLGGRRAITPMPWHSASYGHPGSTWMAWYAQAVQRDVGLPSSSLEQTRLLGCIEDVLTMITNQSRYHTETAARSAVIEHRLHVVGVTLMTVTLLAGALHVAAALDPLSMVPSPPFVGTLIFVCGFLPALGAALAGIGNQAEFRRVAKRSTAMREHFNELANRTRALQDALKATPPRPLSRQASTEITELAWRATEHMINEVLDWRVMFIDRPLDPPA